ncbi:MULTISPECIES: hypothetical protein [Myroides]|uniref:Uncharacterized protein n=2 Tax=Myroides TaxID=76831 RepID=A0A378RIM6_MYROD|nr:MULTISPECIES: hypothetical protein [Myroides]MDH6600353.1 hypothetical protein [Myroides gitamensis]EHO09855.1 hypothetical protein HMPREF9715_02279 [Myroides odoratimimus CIP 101113]EHQ44230.1 hypothetical protein Myrod_3424 [Myroides odoratus DSM 2801]EKB05876.1 hypothetical protein HMPREF9716_02669 [Myroides odoratus CIP 103059]MCS4238712.1 hypothetical protein [Myroides odoratus]
MDKKDEKNKALASSSQNEIKNHREAAGHLESAVKYHLDAAKHYEDGLVEKAVECNTKAQACTEKAISETGKKMRTRL